MCVDLVHRLVAGGGPRSPVGLHDPAFRIGDRAPDFMLPDRSGNVRRLSTLVTRDTMLCFTCGCSNCLQLQKYLAILIRQLGPRAPSIVTVTTMPREREDSWYRDTHLRQIILYEKKEGPIAAEYGGRPCPRFYRLRRDLAVVWISPSPADVPFVDAVGHQMAQALGFAPPRSHGPGPMQ